MSLNIGKILFGATTEYAKYDSSTTALSTSEGGPIVISVKGAFSFGIQSDKFNKGGHQMCVILSEHPGVLDALHDIERQCADNLVLNLGPAVGLGAVAVSGLKEGDDRTLLYAGLMSNVIVRRETNRSKRVTPKSCMGERGDYNVALIADSLCRKGATASVRVKVRELMLLEESEEEVDDGWVEMF